jgi:lipopolysaccharide transport system permease protein
MTAFTLFRSGSTQAMRSIISSSGIWKVMYVPKYIYVISAVASNFVTYVLSLSVLFGIMFVLNVKFTVFILFASLPILILLVLTVGAGLIMATINVFFRDMEHLYAVFCTMLMYAMPIFYPADIVPPRFRIFQTYNPLLQIIEALRDCFLYGKLYEPFMIYYSAICAVILLAIGLLLFYKYQDKFILYV